MANKKIIHRGKITYYISENSVVVGVGGGQYISYNVYNSPSRSNLAEFKKLLANSKENQYNNVIDAVDLARRCSLIGSGTQKPSWEEDEKETNKI